MSEIRVDFVFFPSRKMGKISHYHEFIITNN